MGLVPHPHILDATPLSVLAKTYLIFILINDIGQFIKCEASMYITPYIHTHIPIHILYLILNL